MKIVTYPDFLLTWPTCMVADFDGGLRKLAESMIQTAIEAKGLGLAANQVGSDLSLFVFKTGNEFIVAVNPTVTPLGNTINVADEGCLSLPGLWTKIPRASQVITTFFDLDGKEHSRQDEGLLARELQHEMDHLAGKLMWDRVSQLNRDILKRRYKKINKSRKG